MVGTASTFAVAPGLYKRLAYDPVKDFAPIMLFATVPFVLVVNPSLPVNSVKEMVALAKSKPGELPLPRPASARCTTSPASCSCR